MIVYAESNLVLELALQQAEATACERLLELAAANRIELVLPSLSIAEPYWTCNHRARKREELHTRMVDELRQIGRSLPHAEQVHETSQVVGILLKVSEAERNGLEGALGRLLGASTVADLDSAGYTEAMALQRSRGLEPHDAIIYATVLRHMRGKGGEPKCFLNRNTKDFLTPEIETDLSALNCTLIPTFADGVAHIEAALR